VIQVYLLVAEVLCEHYDAYRDFEAESRDITLELMLDALIMPLASGARR